MRENKVIRGVRDAWDLWLSRHPVTVPACIVSAIRGVFRKRLDDREEEIIAEIAKQSNRG
jgi:hypothetical protein